MTQTFTPVLDAITAEQTKEAIDSLSPAAEPSERTIQNILNYSKNLEVKHSQLVDTISVIKS